MQTFMPLLTYEESAYVLDRQRLGKQRVETKQILQTLLGESAGWRHHPAVKMWAGYESALCRYGQMCRTWSSRGYIDNLYGFFEEKYGALPLTGDPLWVGKTDFHASHRSNLLRKAPEWYGKFGWSEGPDMPYYWPKEVKS
jgi:hypothetical protein